MASSAPKPQPWDLTVPHMKGAAFNSAVIVTAFFGLQKVLKSPEIVRAIPRPLLKVLPLLAKVAGVLCAVRALSHVSRIISHKASNNWIKDETWDWSKEIVVITGASSGIGELVAQDLASRGIKVMNLDLHPPRKSQGKFQSNPYISKSQI